MSGVGPVEWLVSKPDPLHREEGSGHMLTFEFSPGRNADLTNDCQRWLMMPLKRFISPGFHVFSVTNDYTVKLIGSFNHGVISYPAWLQTSRGDSGCGSFTFILETNCTRQL